MLKPGDRRRACPLLLPFVRTWSHPGCRGWTRSGRVYRMRAARGRNQSCAEEVCTPVVLAARIDVLSLCLDDLSAERAPAFRQPARMDLLPARSLFLRGRVGPRRT